MNSRHLTLALTALNLMLLGVLLTAARPAKIDPRDIPSVLRARSLELIDEHGVVRSRINVEEGGGVVLRMTDQKGRIRVKLGAGEDGSGLLLNDETTEPGIHLIARQRGTAKLPNTTAITVQAGDRKRVFTP